MDEPRIHPLRSTEGRVERHLFARPGMTLLALAALVISFDFVVLADMATYQVPEPWPTARFLASRWP